MRILHTSFECYPLSKVGGLADVVGSLPKYLNNIECTAEVITPLYDKISIKNQQFDVIFEDTLVLGTQQYDFEIRKIKSKDFGFQIFLVHIPDLLFRSDVYGYEDDTERFIAFQLVVLNWVLTLKNKPTVLHCHDHHTGLIPFLVSQAFKYKDLSNISTIITIHNAQYQGEFSHDKMSYIPEFDFKQVGLLDWYGKINPLASAIKCARKVTTVSPSYMIELQKKANGLEGLLSGEKDKCIGILNGIDEDTWNPKLDPMLDKQYETRNIISGRKANKNWLCANFDLKKTKPLFAFIGRLVYEKGADLLPEIISQTLKNIDCTILILGSGNKEIEEQLLQQKFPNQYHAFIGYDEKLSHIIYAGADFLLMPSRVEPCGLNQMYALRYGAIPIVRRTGGLKDTIIDIGDDGYGICHDQASVADVVYSIQRGMEVYEDQKLFKKIQKKITTIDNSWNRSAKKYKALYKSLKSLDI